MGRPIRASLQLILGGTSQLNNVERPKLTKSEVGTSQYQLTSPLYLSNLDLFGYNFER